MKLYNMNFYYDEKDRLPADNLERLVKLLLEFSKSGIKIAVYGMGKAGQKILSRLSKESEVSVSACFDAQFENLNISTTVYSPDYISDFHEIDLIINTAPPQYLFDINKYIMSKNEKLAILNLYDLSAYLSDNRNWDYSYRILVKDNDLKGPLAEYHKLIASIINKRVKTVLAKIESQRVVSPSEILEELEREQCCLGEYLNKEFEKIVHLGENRIEGFLTLAERFPFFTIARDAAATLLIKEGKFQDAVKVFKPSLDMYPCCRFSLQKMAELQALCGNFEESKRNICEGLFFFPNSLELNELSKDLELGNLRRIRKKWNAREVRPVLKKRKVSLRCAVPVWGEKFIKIFMELCLGSLLSSGNIPYTSKRYDICFEIYSYENEFDIIRSYPQWEILNSVVPVELIDIDSITQDFQDRFNFTNKYSHMSICHNYALERSAKDGSALFILLADFIFSNNFVKKALLKLEMGYDVVFSTGLRASLQKIHKNVNPEFMKNNIFEVPDEDFLELGISSMHPFSSKAKSKNHTPIFPNYFVYEDEFGNILYSIYGNNPVFIFPRNLNLQMDTTFDADLPYRATDGGLGQYAFSDDIDGMFLFEIVDENSEIDRYVKRNRKLDECAYWIYGRVDPLLRYFGTRVMQYKKSKSTKFRDEVYSEFIRESISLVL
ncbi:hypothetical protein [Desulfovibrio gilichinskyi]|uniref:Uncharacterized protein n=1 Tax=Desulfovibrio gilichinskyi TaxID=1519643 RepID=A0A1X7EAQ7_9BACT|nr:hypothetical protein [Desulfovibrio gilichinskyi]SMF30583.1 hypothetical protein SAMN06295933_2839 [Desulfovibrio gilichinskyi]